VAQESRKKRQAVESPKPDEPLLEKVLGDLEAGYQELESQVRDVSARIDRRAGRTLWQAIAVGLGLGGVFLLSLFVAKWTFALLVGILVAVAVVELVAGLRRAGGRLSAPWMVVTSLGVIGASWWAGAVGMLWGMLGAIVAVTVVRMGGAIFLASQRPTLWRDLQSGVFVVVYLPFLGSFGVVVQGLPGGQWWVLAAVVIVVTVDTSAYATGVAIGRHKLAPRISPGKTWEGLAGAIVAGAAAGAMLGEWVIDVGWLTGLVFGLVVVGSATLGDLVESLIKRDIGIKDMSSFLPGHGGVLDRLDSILPTLAVTYIAYQLVV
jgi:phosphatidate cytidylyltransferase